MKNVFQKIFILSALLCTIGCEENPISNSKDNNSWQQSKAIEISRDLSQENSEWLKKNQVKLQKMTREEIAQLNGSLQREIFRALSPEKRKELWRDKMAHLKTIVNKPMELEFISQMETIIKNKSFDKSLNKEEFEYYENMLSDAMVKFDWDKTFIIYAFGTLHDMNKKITPENDFFGTFETPNGGVIEGIFAPPGFGTIPDCNCNWGWCPGGSCDSSNCDETIVGCSFLLLGPCDEKCVRDY